MGRTCTIVLLLLCAPLLSVGCKGKPDDSSNAKAQAEHNVDPKADKVLKEMSDHLGAAESFSFKATGLMDEHLKAGQLAQYSRTTRMFIRRPDKVYAITSGEDVARTACYDGAKLTVFDRSANTYAAINAPKSIEKLLDLMVEEYGLTLPVADFLFANTYETLTEEVQSGRYLGLHAVGDRECHHLAFRQETIDWQLWIDAGDAAVPRKLVIIYKTEAGRPTYSATMDDWDLSASHAEGRFRFKAPADAKEISMTEMFKTEQGE